MTLSYFTDLIVRLCQAGSILQPMPVRCMWSAAGFEKNLVACHFFLVHSLVQVVESKLREGLVDDSYQRYYSQRS